MRSRAYRPEAPVCLEQRSLSSVIAGHSAEPYVFSRRRFNAVGEHIRRGFVLAGRYLEPGLIQKEVEAVIVWVPFQHADRLQEKIDGIVDRMREDAAAGVPHALRSGLNDVMALIHESVEARVRAGEVVIR